MTDDKREQLRALRAVLAKTEDLDQIDALTEKVRALVSELQGPKPEPSVSNGSGEHFVDMTVHDDYVIIAGTKLEREKAFRGGNVQDWRTLWEHYRGQLLKRGSMKGVNRQNEVGFGSDMDLFRKMVARGE